jgi:hypothetical protein
MSRKHTRPTEQPLKRGVSSAAGFALKRLTDAMPDGEKLEELGARAADRLASAGQRGISEAGKRLRSAAVLAQDHPRATASALLGVGVLVGARHPVPTIGLAVGGSLLLAGGLTGLAVRSARPRAIISIGRRPSFWRELAWGAGVGLAVLVFSEGVRVGIRALARARLAAAPRAALP